jgi:antibiotic biosynthesis monooxygenase
MTAFNVVRVRVKPGREEEFIEAHRRMKTEDFPGSRRGVLVKTGERSYCVIGEWESMEALVASRPQMLFFAAGFRDTLEDLGSDLGFSDAVSGEVILDSSEDPASRAFAERMA